MGSFAPTIESLWDGLNSMHKAWIDEHAKCIDLEARNKKLVNGGDFGWNRVFALTQALKFAEHKIDQHLQGQYNHPPFPALGAALAEIRNALGEEKLRK